MNLLENLKHSFNKKSIYWATNYPKAWSLGWLTQLFIAAILYVLTFIVSLLIPVSSTDTPSILSWIGLAYIPAFLWAIFIIYRLIKYNTEKLYGNRNWVHNFIEIPTYIALFSMPLLIPLILGTVLTFRVGNLITVDQLNENKIAYEEAEPFFTFNYGSGNYMWNSYSENYSNKSYYGNTYEMFQYYINDEAYYHFIKEGADDYNMYEYIDERSHDELYKIRDSLQYYRTVMRDSIAGHRGVFKDSRPKLYPHHFFKFHYTANQTTSEDLGSYDYLNVDSVKQLYFYNHYKDDVFVQGKLDKHLLCLNDFREEKTAVISSKELFSLFNDNFYNEIEKKGLAEKVKQLDNHFSNYRNQMNYIEQCKERKFHFLNDSVFYAILFGFIFSFALILSLFKNLSWQEFLIGLFVIFLISALLGIFMAISRWGEDPVILTFWGLAIGLSIWSVIEQNGNVRRKRGAILFMVPHLCLAFLPVAILGTLDEVFHFWTWDYFDNYLILMPREHDLDYMDYSSSYYDMKRAAVGNMFTLGYVLYLFIIYPLWIKVGWLKFMAKPTKS